MTEQTIHNEWAAPPRSPYQADPDRYDTHPAEHRAADTDAAVPEATTADHTIDEQPADPSTLDDESGTEEAAAGHPAAVPPHADAEPPADIADEGDVNTSDGGPPVPSPNGRYGAEEPAADAAPAVREPEAAEQHDAAAVASDSSSPVHHVEEHADVAAAEVPVGAAPAADVSGTGVAGSGELLPGGVAPEPVMALLDGATTARFRDRWQQLQLRFIDDPHAVAAHAGALVDEVVTALHDAVDQRRSALEDGQSGDGVDAHAGDTERLRVSVRRYRDFLDHLLRR
jgi:hypothetical protein